MPVRVARSTFTRRCASLTGFRFSPLAELSQPGADGQVVELERGVGDEERQREGAEAECDVLAGRRRRVVLHPCLLHVDEREVREVDRIGNLAEEFAKTISLLFIAL